MMKPSCFAVLLERMRSCTSLAERYSVGLEVRAMSGSCLTSVDWKHSAGNPRRLVGSEVQSHQRDVFWLSEASEWEFSEALLSRRFWIGGLGQEKKRHLGLNDGRAHAVHTNLIFRVIERHRSRQSGDAGLCCAIRDTILAANDPEVRPDIHDRTSS